MENEHLNSFEIEFDPAKDRQNRAIHGIGLDAAADFEFHTAEIWEDSREDYGETRYFGLGFIGVRLYAIVLTLRGRKLRAISLRKATKTEQRAYVNERG